MKITVTCFEGEELESSNMYVNINVAHSKEQLQAEFKATGSENELVVLHEEITEPAATIDLLDAISRGYDEGQEEIEKIFTQIYMLGLKRGLELTKEEK